MPSAALASRRPSAPSLGERLTNAVLHDLAKSTWNGTLPSAMSCEFRNGRPSTVLFLGQSTGVSAVTAFFCSNPSVDTILYVEPGGTWPDSAVFTVAPSGPFATAS